MENSFEIGEIYNARNYLQCGYEFPDWNYELLAIVVGFPEEFIKNKEEIEIANEQWLEGLYDTEQYESDKNGLSYYFKFPQINDNIDGMWIPKSVSEEVFVNKYK